MGEDDVEDLIPELFTLISELVPRSGDKINFGVLDFFTQKFEVIFPVDNGVRVALDNQKGAGPYGIVLDLFFPCIEVVEEFER